MHPPAEDLAQPVINAVVAHVLRWGRPPCVVLATSDDALEIVIASELLRRGFEVRKARHASQLHEAVLAACEDPAHGIDLLIADAQLAGCAPYHAIGFARGQRLRFPVVVVAAHDDEVARRESERQRVDLTTPATAIAAIDRAMLRELRRLFVTERPPATAA